MITYTVEKLHHFLCNNCGSWWSVGDYTPPPTHVLTCPFCGSKATPQRLCSQGNGGRVEEGVEYE